MLAKNEIDAIYNNYEEECQKYFNRIYSGLKRILYEGWDKFGQQFDFLYDLYIFQNYLLDIQEQYFQGRASICISSFYSKIASDILSLYQCLRQGQIISSMSIERNIFESFVNLKLIMDKNIEERIKLYEDFAIVQRWNRIQEFNSYIENLERMENVSKEHIEDEKIYFNRIITPEEVNAIKLDYEKIKENYLLGRPFHWAWKIYKDEIQKGRNPSLSFICDKLDISSLYMQVYSLNSIVVHSESLMTGMLIQDGGITPTANFNDNLKSIAGTSSFIAIDIILLVLKYVRSPKFEEVKLYLQEKWLRIF